MRILYIDIDCLRPDHLGCYGYHRATSPHIDAIAAQGVRFTGVYASDAPCLPSRTALFSGRFGIHTGVIGHGGAAAELFPEGASRGFNSILGRTSWMRCLRDAGLHTASISPFADRHGAHHFAANFAELHNPGRRGLELGDEIGAIALDWLQRNAQRDDWFLHVNLWDPHTPYRTPREYGEPFASDPLPAWYTEAVRERHWCSAGPHSAREVCGFEVDPTLYRPAYPRQPLQIDSMAAARALFDGYDTGIRYADDWVGRLLSELAGAGVADDCAILLSADHGENLGELGVYGDHQSADEYTCRVPFIVRWPGITESQAGRVDTALRYQVDLAALVAELVGTGPFSNWDGAGFEADFRAGKTGAGREFLVLSQGAWSCQRGVRFRDDEGDWLCLRTYHDGYHLWNDYMLFDLARDPHEEQDVATARPELVAKAMGQLEQWTAEMMRSAHHPTDPMWRVIEEGGPTHVRGKLAAYLERLRATERHEAAEELAARHPAEC